MKKTLTIGTPCHEDWNLMTPNAEGRHCDVCNKTVVDLTQKSQPEMVALFEEKGGDMCGRMMMPVKKSEPMTFGSRPALRGRLRQFALALLAAMGFISFGALCAEAQSTPVPGAIAYVATADAGVHVILNDAPTGGVQVQIKRGQTVLKETTTNAEGFASFPDLLVGDYTIVVRHENQKLASRQLSLESYGANEYFWFEKKAGRWQEQEKLMLLGDTVGYYEVEPVGLLEEIVEKEATTGEPVMVDESFTMGKPAICTDKSGEGLEKVAPQPVKMDLKVFPNPMDGLFRAEIIGTHKGDGVHLMVFDASGKVLHQETHLGGEDLFLEVDLSDAAAGIYFVKVVHGAAMLEKRVVRM